LLCKLAPGLGLGAPAFYAVSITRLVVLLSGFLQASSWALTLEFTLAFGWYFVISFHSKRTSSTVDLIHDDISPLKFTPMPGVHKPLQRSRTSRADERRDWPDFGRGETFKAFEIRIAQLPWGQVLKFDTSFRWYQDLQGMVPFYSDGGTAINASSGRDERDR